MSAIRDLLGIFKGPAESTLLVCESASAEPDAFKEDARRSVSVFITGKQALAETDARELSERGVVTAALESNSELIADDVGVVTGDKDRGAGDNGGLEAVRESVFDPVRGVTGNSS